MDSSQLKRTEISNALTTWSDAVGRYLMNSDKALNLDIKLTFAKDLRCQRSAGADGYLSLYECSSRVYNR